MRSSAALVLLAALGMSGRASAAPLTLSGRWSASAMTSSWNFGSWDEACGPKPSGSSAPAGTVTIADKGGELSISGAGRTYSTTQCWEQYPGLARVSHSGGSRGWKTTCKTSASDPRQATVVTTVTASDSYMTLDETGQYQFVVQGQNCTASVRRSRSFRLIQREGEAAPAPPSALPSASVPAPAPPPAPARVETRVRACDEPGPPTKLEVRPARKLMRPGETFTFRAIVLDAAGCAARVAPSFKLESANAQATLTSAGKVQVAESAAEGEIVMVASVAGRSVRVVVEVASNERYAALLESKGLTSEGESREAAVTAIASASVGSRSAVAEDRARARRTVFIGVIGALALVLGIVGFVLVLRSRKKQRASIVPGRPEQPPGTPAPKTASTSLYCPTCREEYEPGAQFCPLDGNRLVAIESTGGERGPAGGVCPVCGQGFDPGVGVCPTHDEELVPIGVYRARLDAPAELARVCPVCGTQYPGDGQFCGRDGALLVPMN